MALRAAEDCHCDRGAYRYGEGPRDAGKEQADDERHPEQCDKDGAVPSCDPTHLNLRSIELLL
jgi:hypothetical protein